MDAILGIVGGGGIHEENPAEDPGIGTDRKTVFSFAIDHVHAPDPSLNISSPGAVIGIPPYRRKIEVGDLSIQQKATLVPEGDEMRTIYALLRYIAG